VIQRLGGRHPVHPAVEVERIVHTEGHLHRFLGWTRYSLSISTSPPRH
jgi:hypothetical protein